jgi:hypothetical protein
MLERRFFTPDFVGIVQRRPHDPFAEWFEHHHALAPRHQREGPVSTP